jgi:hypothetical protein
MTAYVDAFAKSLMTLSYDCHKTSIMPFGNIVPIAARQFHHHLTKLHS